MNFVSLEYGYLLLAAFILFWISPRPWRIRLLFAASYLFYMAWDVRFVALLLASSTTYYLCGLGIANKQKSPGKIAALALLPGVWLALCSVFEIQGKTVSSEVLIAAFSFLPVMLGANQLIGGMPSDQGRRKGFLWLALGINLGLLGFFKYFNFFAESVGGLVEQFGLSSSWTLTHIILPVGISFYTFQAISYIVDIKNKKIEPTDCFITFATYLAFFPQLIAGPIERSTKLLPQLIAPAKWDISHLHIGLRLLLIGFFKKLFVADNCAILANHVFVADNPEINTAWALLGVLAFAFQIYGDFSGYSDIARGSARLLGIELSLNFRFPYFALNPSEFWRRWHITLSTWFRDYVYIPLGGNQGAWGATCRNLAIAMVLAGLWHGAAWTFILWGAYHACLLMAFHYSPRWQQACESGRAAKLACWVGMCGLTLIGWAIFRSDSMFQFYLWFTGIFQWQVTGAMEWEKPARWLLLHIGPLLLLQWATLKERDEASLDHHHWATRGFIYLLLFVFTATSMVNDQEFIYFQF